VDPVGDSFGENSPSAYRGGEITRRSSRAVEKRKKNVGRREIKALGLVGPMGKPAGASKKHPCNPWTGRERRL